MKKLSFIFLLLTAFTASSQSYLEKQKMLETQRTEAGTLLDLLEAGNVVDAMSYFKGTSITKELLQQYSDSLQIYKQLHRSIVVVMKEGHNIHRCRYSLPNYGDSWFQLDFHVRDNNEKCEIVKCEVKYKKQMLEELARRKGTGRRNKRPPPPPPPPGSRK